MNRAALPDQIHDCFLIASDGFNGLAIHDGSRSWLFDCEWPGNGELCDHLVNAWIHPFPETEELA